MTPRPNATTIETLDLPERRLEDGQCPNCGQQLFKKPRKHLFSRNKPSETHWVPLSIPGYVARGQCQRCTDRETCVDPLESTSAVYEGPVNYCGERHGVGRLQWMNGDVYKGDFQRDLMHGQGTLEFSDGSEYVGQWSAGLMHGAGTRRYANGDMYVGDYVDGQRCGKGRFYFANGDLYVGSFDKDALEGRGRYYFANGRRFEGYFSKGRRHGPGKTQRQDGVMEVYNYDNDRRSGDGVRWSADRQSAWRLSGNGRPQSISLVDAVGLVFDIQQDKPIVDACTEHVV